jgi:hypothetical protein
MSLPDIELLLMLLPLDELLFVLLLFIDEPLLFMPVLFIDDDVPVVPDIVFVFWVVFDVVPLLVVLLFCV